MSSNDSTSSSRLSQFGLYRTIDARTEEFLKLSRRRQIRQGCACAAVSTAVTVTVVVVILIIYEYAIAVEWSIVQNTRALRRSDNISVTNDTPVADRLDRSYFGFDQDYYERMPLLVNAMQENSYVDPFIDSPTHKLGKSIATTTQTTTKTPRYQGSIRRTSPRPFIYEMRSPTPVPFSKTFGSKSWIESYRNAQRLKNVQEIIKYLEKTINAKVADLHAVPSTHIAFSGVYMEPMLHKHDEHSQEDHDDLLAVSSNKAEFVKSNHQSDPLYRFKPEVPSDVNMLADSFLRFLPVSTPRIPMFKPIPNKNNPLQSSSDKQSTVLKPKTFSVMLSLFPMLTSHADWKKAYTTKPPPVSDIISITTTRRPLFRRKSSMPVRRVIQYKRPRLRSEPKIDKHKPQPISYEESHQNVSHKQTSMILHINLYAPEKTTELNAYNNTILEQHYTTPAVINYETSTETPWQTSTVKVEDFHIGSSGIIPVESRSNPAPSEEPLPKVSTLIPFFDITPSSNVNTFSTPTPTEIMKFSHEDAKIPQDYQKMRSEEEYNHHFEMERRSMMDSFESKLEFGETTMSDSKTYLYPSQSSQNQDHDLTSNLKDWEQKTLLVKLKNMLENQTKDNPREISENGNAEITTQSNTKQINGHSRNLNSKIVNSWLDPNSEANRKRRFELYAKGFRRANISTTYVEINRNHTARNDSDTDVL